MGDLADIRRYLRRKRLDCLNGQRLLLSRHAAEHALVVLERCGDIASVGVFLSLSEEIDTTPLIEALFARDFPLYLPVVTAPREPLVWRHYHPGGQLSKDVAGIRVPVKERWTQERRFPPELVVTPLVGYDRCGNRLGMGGGFYDRTFAGKTSGSTSFLLGFACSCQEWPNLPVRPWDVPLDALANENELLCFN